MSAPTPLTRTSIVLLSESSVKPVGTLRSSPKSIQRILAALISGLAKTTQLQMKLIDTATTEMNALRPDARRVTRAMSTAPASGTSKTSQGITLINILVHKTCGRTPNSQRQTSPDSCFLFGGLEFQTINIFYMGGATGTIERDNYGKTDRDLGGGDSNDKENQDLRVVIGQAIVAETKTGKGDKGEIGRIQHQLQRHENDNDIAPQQNAAKTDGEQYSADSQIVAERGHRNWRLLKTMTPIVATRISTAIT